MARKLSPRLQATCLKDHLVLLSRASTASVMICGFAKALPII